MIWVIIQASILQDSLKKVRVLRAQGRPFAFTASYISSAWLGGTILSWREAMGLGFRV